jgi:hypothetical protein
MKRLLIAALSCGACMLTGSAMAADSAVITATGTVPGTCNVEGANLTLYPTTPSSLVGYKDVLWSTNSSNAVFSMSNVIMQTPATEGQSQNIVGQIFGSFEGQPEIVQISRNTQGEVVNVTPAPYNGVVIVGAQVVEQNQQPLLAGEYSLATTVTCIIP